MGWSAAAVAAEPHAHVATARRRVAPPRPPTSMHLCLRLEALCCLHGCPCNPCCPEELPQRGREWGGGGEGGRSHSGPIRAATHRPRPRPWGGCGRQGKARQRLGGVTIIIKPYMQTYVSWHPGAVRQPPPPPQAHQAPCCAPVVRRQDNICATTRQHCGNIAAPARLQFHSSRVPLPSPSPSTPLLLTLHHTWPHSHPSGP